MPVPRERPQLNEARTTFVADNGQRLRGPYTSTEWTAAVPAANIAQMKELGFNAVHLYAEVFSLNYPTSGNPPGYNVAEVDKIVAATRTNGLYLVMTIGNGANNGNHNNGQPISGTSTLAAMRTRRTSSSRFTMNRWRGGRPI